VITVVYTVVLYAAFALFAGGLAWRLWQYLRTPAPLKIPTTPAPVTRGGVALRLLREAILFESLFRASRWTWLLGWIFHAALVLVLLQHLRYLTAGWWGWVAWLHAHGLWASGAMLAGLAGLWARRVLVDRVRYVSSPSDHLMLALLVALAASGMWMKYHAPADVVAVKDFVRGLVLLDWRALPAHGPLLLHLGLFAVLLAVFPFSKLLHAPGLFLAPTRYQVDDARLSGRGAGRGRRGAGHSG